MLKQPIFSESFKSRKSRRKLLLQVSLTDISNSKCQNNFSSSRGTQFLPGVIENQFTTSPLQAFEIILYYNSYKVIFNLKEKD